MSGRGGRYSQRNFTSDWSCRGALNAGVRDPRRNVWKSPERKPSLHFLTIWREASIRAHGKPNVPDHSRQVYARDRRVLGDDRPQGRRTLPRPASNRFWSSSCRWKAPQLTASTGGQTSRYASSNAAVSWQAKRGPPRAIRRKPEYS
jgi:hypothetical protein